MKKKYRILLCLFVLIAFVIYRFVMIGTWLDKALGQNLVDIYGSVILFTVLEGYLIVLLCIQIAKCKSTVSFDDPDDGYVPLNKFKKNQENTCQLS